MEDPWANAWGEPTKPGPESLPASTAWSAPSVPAIHGDHEDDLSLPSWSVQPTAAQWSDPDTAEALWSDDTSTVWNPFTTTVDKISLSTDSVVSESEIEVPPPVPTEDVPEFRPSSPTVSLTPKDDTPPVSPTVDSPVALPSHSPQLSMPVPPPLSIGPVEDLDAFGTFETANDDADSEEWSPARPGFSLPSADAAVWGGSWEESPAAASADTNSEASTELDDAWEVARQQKEKQDRHVSPELLASILKQFEDLSKDFWPNDVASSTNSHDTQLPMDMEEHLGLAPIVLKLVPKDLTLPATVPFPKKFTSKQMSEALKMTRHTPLTRISPMTFYMSSKGLTSWEASVKAKPNILQEDFTPAGWKILEAAKGEVPSPDDPKKKPNGGLLSFFGRRATNSASDAQNATTSRSSSPVSISGTASVKPGTSPRPSIDSGRRSTSQSQAGGSTAPSSPSVPSFGANPAAIQTKESNPLPDNSTTSTIMSPGSQEIEITPQPSAVSRFLGRFSARSTKSSNSQDSLALSSDDLEFLSDVPTVDTNSDTSTGLDALSMMLKSPPIPTALPTPLKPPPRAPPYIPKIVPKEQPPADDFMSFFDNDNEHVPSGPSLSPLTPVPTPPVITLTQLPSSSVQALPANTTSNTIKSSVQSSQTNESNNDQSWPSFDYPSAPMNKPAQTKRPFVAIMASSSKTTSTPPPLLPKPTSGFALPPPPSTRRTTISSGTGSSNISPLPPPPTSRAHTPLRPLQQANSPPPPPSTIDDDDDFADFLSSPTNTTQTTQLSFGDFAPSIPSTVNQSSSTQQASSGNLFDGFDDFVSPPPQPPAKPLPQKSFSPPIHSSNIPKSNNHGTPSNHKPVRVANHSKTLSLMETAAARGRWLAPPSPLPEALPPPETSNGKSSNVDFFSSGSTMQAQQAQAAASLATSSPSLSSNASNEKPPLWDFSPPSNRTFLAPIPQSTQATFSAPPSKPQPLMQPLVAQNSAPTPTGTKTGGLSAQDLSFFEGL